MYLNSRTARSLLTKIAEGLCTLMAPYLFRRRELSTLNESSWLRPITAHGILNVRHEWVLVTARKTASIEERFNWHHRVHELEM